MSTAPRFAYVQARLQARHGARPEEREWRRLEAIGELDVYLQLARHTALRPWVIPLQPARGAHGIELALREQYRRYIDEVAHWMPGRWGEPVRWVKRLLDLPALQQLLAGDTAPAWMSEDPELRRFAVETYGARVQALKASECAVLVMGWRAGDPLYAVWLEHWRALWPPTRRLATGLELLARLLLRQIGAFSLLSEVAGAPLHETLGRELTYVFRRYSFLPAAAFAHLGLVALDLQRLRAQLLQRLLFAAPVSPA